MSRIGNGSVRVLALAICIAIPGFAKAGLLEDLAKSVKNTIPFNPFDTVGNELNKLVDAGEFEKARTHFSANFKDYYDKKFNKEKSPATEQLKKLGKWHWDKDFSVASADALAKLSAVQKLDQNEGGLWSRAKIELTEAEKTLEDIRSSDLLKISGGGAESIVALSNEVSRVQMVASRDRAAALFSTFVEVMRTGVAEVNYPIKNFDSADYRSNSTFQTMASDLVASRAESERELELKKLESVIAASTVEKFRREGKMKQALARLGPAPYPLEKLAELRDLVKEFGADSGLQAAVKIGYVDLTASSFKDRNVFDFELSFERDYGLTLEDAKEAFLGKGQPDGYDFIFITDLSAAKILREFKNKRDVGSKTQSGTRQEQNPEYVGAMASYQSAMTEMQSVQLQNAQSSQSCSGSAIQCILLAALKGASEGNAKKNFKEKADALARTPQMVAKPVFSNYNYQLVDISAAKLAQVDYYVIDVKRKKVFSSYFEVKDSEKFTVSYSVEEGDPDRDSILRNNRREEDVTAWEKRPINVKLSTLFNPQNLLATAPKPFTTAEAFLKPLNSRQYASASPTYVQASGAKSEVRASSGRVDSGVVADERFDSVVIIKTSKAIGTGFYITPDLVLTAFHVVDGSNLVEMTFYDGTKTFGKVVDSDVRLDLALVKAQTVGKPVKIYSGPIRLGETAEAIGHPKGYHFTITRGVVSAIRKQTSAVLKAGPLIEFVQTDTPISPGNSGGPLFLKDAVIGVNDWVRVDKASQNLNFSVSFNEIREYLNRFEGKSK